MNPPIIVREENILAVRRTINMHRQLAEGKRASAGAAAEDQAEKFLDTALAHEDVALHLERALLVLFGAELLNSLPRPKVDTLIPEPLDGRS